MRTFAHLLTALALATSPACAEDPGSPAPWFEPDSMAVEGPLLFGSDGRTPSFALEAEGAASVALWVRGEPGSCFAIDRLEDGVGAPWVSRREPGPYCVDCRLRVSSGMSEALIVLADPEGSPFAGDLRAQFGLLDCETLTPITRRPATSPEAGGKPSLEVRWLRREAAPKRGSLALRLLISSRAALFEQAEQPRKLIARLNLELAATGIEAHVREVLALTSTPDVVTFSMTELDELSALREAAPPPPQATVDVVLAGCLMYDDPFFGPPVAVHGFTPRVGGGAGAAAAVFLPTLRCDGAASPLPQSVEVQAHLLAHELGHFLGLYHSVEVDGTTDLLSDTGPDNTMHYDPNRARARGFTALQAHHMRSHPWVRPAERRSD